MQYVSEQEFIQEYNKIYGQVIHQERRKRKLSLEELSSGVLSRTALEKVEKGKSQWTKLTGDTLMLRMGVLPEYFESLSAGEELERWRMREDICLLVPDKQEEAAAKLKEYRDMYAKREPLEEQFLLKAEVILMFSQVEGYRGHMETGAAAVLDKARQAAGCTISGDWERHLEERWLSPGELGAVLLVSAALFLNGSENEAWELWQTVWEYPKAHNWQEREMVLILPQTAILGIRQSYVSGGFHGLSALRGGLEEKMLLCGQEALELLRRNGCHCYALPLLDALCGMKETLFGKREDLEQVREFREMFRSVYEWFAYPGYRIWQGISVDNTRDVGVVLKMLRKFYGISRENGVFDGNEPVITPRQLEKIEKGIHKPSYENYNRLVRQYGKYGGWNMPLLETDSADILELRQRISTLMGYDDWEHAEWEIRRFRSMLNPEYPKVRQELLFFDAALKWKKEGALQESLEMMRKALHCTVPDFAGRDMKLWVFQREEIMIASNIATLYRKLGNMEEAKNWFEAVLFSIEQNISRTDIIHYGYDIVALGYSNYLGDVHSYADAEIFSEKTTEKLLRCYRINCIRHLFYHIAWNAREDAFQRPEGNEFSRQKWRKAFHISELMADFMYDTHLLTLLENEKQNIYLSIDDYSGEFVTGSSISAGFGLRVLELMFLQMMYFLLFSCLKNITASFLLTMSLYLSVIYINGRWLPFGLSSLYRVIGSEGDGIYRNTLISAVIFIFGYFLIYGYFMKYGVVRKITCGRD